MNDKKFALLVGYTGVGKTTIVRYLEKTGFATLNFSEQGKDMAFFSQNSKEFKNITNEILYEIQETVNCNKFVIVDGLASQLIEDELKRNGYNILVINLSVNEKVRLRRISKRENLSISDAIIHDKVKEQGKMNAGLQYLIDNADVTINGNLPKQVVLYLVKRVLKNFYQN